MENLVSKKVPAEIELKPMSGWPMLFISIAAYLFAILLIIVGGIFSYTFIGVGFLVIGILYACFGWIFWLGLKVVKPNEALVLTLFGKYTGTIMEEGFYFVNPFSTAAYPHKEYEAARAAAVASAAMTGNGEKNTTAPSIAKTISLKALTLDNQKQKINDLGGNPIEVGIVVIWRVVSPAKAVFSVDDYKTFVSIQADSALRDVVRLYPYDNGDEDNSPSLRESSNEVSSAIKAELEKRVADAGIEILDTRITHLAYAPEIAAAMLQRQQATAIIEARQKIVDGAVGMVEMALRKLDDGSICNLDDERKAQMVSNLLVVLCSGKDAQPVVNSSSIY